MSLQDQARAQRARRFLAWMQVVPILFCAVLLSACSGAGGNGSGDFFTSRRSNLFLKGFFALNPQNGNADLKNQPIPVNNLVPVTSYAPYANSNNANVTYSFPDLQSQLEINNGISATITEITVNYTEVDGTPILDRSLSPPQSIGGRFDYRLAATLSLPAKAISSIPVFVNQDPVGAPTDFNVPVQLYSTGIFDFQRVPGANLRPLLAKISFKGKDELDNPFSIVGFIVLQPQTIDIASGDAGFGFTQNANGGQPATTAR